MPGIHNAAWIYQGKDFRRAPAIASVRRTKQKGMPMRGGEGESLNGLTQQSFAGSALFEKTFDEGMALVEETARYLDGKGREESRGLPRRAAMLYAGESMRVTTRLMQAASWLLVQRAVHDGDMEADAALQDRYRLGSKEICLGRSAEAVETLPPALQDLLKRSDNLYRRIARLDDVLFGGEAPAAGARGQLETLAHAFGPD
jgi:regulator of CtrA degradation